MRLRTLPRRLKEAWMLLCGATDLEIELYRIRLRIAEDDFEIEEYDRLFSRHGGCCPGCVFGSKYNNLLDKQERRRKIEKDLVKKIG